MITVGSSQMAVAQWYDCITLAGTAIPEPNWSVDCSSFSAVA